jgi:hypothetical protein
MKAKINILSYNIFIPVLPPLRVYGQYERAERVKEIVLKCEEYEELDVVVMNELIPHSIFDIVTEGMASIGFKYKTYQLKDMLTENGGIVIYSKHEIIQQKFTLFGSACKGTDCLSAKGISYARINKDGMMFNIFGTHLQAWPGAKSQFIREEQIQQMGKLMQSMYIPKNEPVFLCGDLNMDMYENNDHLKHLMFTLGLNIPMIHEDSHPFTVDPENNVLSGSDEPYTYKTENWPDGCVEEYYKTKRCPCSPIEWLDYTLYSKKHLKPLNSYMKSINAKVDPFEMELRSGQVETIRDVSDHFPVLGHFEFTFEKHAKIKTLENYNIDTNENTSQNILFLVLIIIAFIFIICLFVFIFFRIKKKKYKGLYNPNLKT